MPGEADLWATSAAALGIDRSYEVHRFESKHPTGLLGKAPNLDVELHAPGLKPIAIESKFVETYRVARNAFKPSYFSDRALVGWPRVVATGGASNRPGAADIQHRSTPPSSSSMFSACPDDTDRMASLSCISGTGYRAPPAMPIRPSSTGSKKRSVTRSTSGRQPIPTCSLASPTARPAGSNTSVVATDRLTRKTVYERMSNGTKRTTSGFRQQGAHYLRFWTLYLERVRAVHPPWAGRTNPVRGSWVGQGSGIPGTYISVCFGRGGKLRHELYIDTEDTKENEVHI